jgi:hypothetical protein
MKNLMCCEFEGLQIIFKFPQNFKVSKIFFGFQNICKIQMHVPKHLRSTSVTEKINFISFLSDYEAFTWAQGCVTET